MRSCTNLAAITDANFGPAVRGDRWLYIQPSAGGFTGAVCTTAGTLGSTAVIKQFGEDREVYIRLNNIEANNHGVPALALFRGFISRAAFEAGAHYVWEASVEFASDVTLPLWPQAYAALVEVHGLEAVESSTLP
ncbi:hypothetical protein [Pseudogemmobacter bohemicus]|uniref:hypothetical protein n=1 Tax=Pseudogemmobacter bohemicus TaxID=2250708 RepID=UPI00130060F2|nr:hypothetical protein [Pseudogemmobacter bohemicus]